MSTHAMTSSPPLRTTGDPLLTVVREFDHARFVDRLHVGGWFQGRITDEELRAATVYEDEYVRAIAPAFLMRMPCHDHGSGQGPLR